MGFASRAIRGMTVGATRDFMRNPFQASNPFSGGAGNPILLGLGLAKAEDAKAKQYGVDLANKQTQLNEEVRKQGIAAESVRLQEEKDRKRTLFGGDVLGQTSERKSLLGL